MGNSTPVSVINAISEAVITFCAVRPFKVISLNSEQLQKSCLGKLSRAKLQNSFQFGHYADQVQQYDDAVASMKDMKYEAPTSLIHTAILESCNAIFDSSKHNISPTSNLLGLGFSSIDLLRLKMHLQSRLDITNIPITKFFTFPTIERLASHIEKDLQNNKIQVRSQFTKYDPIVVLQAHGGKTPIFFFHPGLGEVLIFMNLASYMTDRPVYALRARGLEGEQLFEKLEEVVNVYHKAIKRMQPNGPYAFAGYSFGSLIAFEITKLMTAAGDEVQFLATFDQAPFTKERARTYDWYVCCLSVAFFLDLIKEDYACSILPAMRLLSKDEVLDHIFGFASTARIKELGLTREKLDRWAQVALNFKTITKDYDPTPSVKHMDVFYTEPLVGLVKANSTEEWFDCFISRWGEVVDEPAYYKVGGGHRTMISPPNLDAFQKVFKNVMESRGL
jgi:thioesterase domain-containing protein/acyl carrier protein